MRVFDRGSGPPVIVVPGLQGRWEWARPALHRLASTCRAISYSLSGDFGSGRRLRHELGKGPCGTHAAGKQQHRVLRIRWACLAKLPVNVHPHRLPRCSRATLAPEDQIG